jgi:hypothetical protein
VAQACLRFRVAYAHDGGEYTFTLSMDLFWLLLEAGVALLLLLGIVWWTWPRKRSDRPDTREPE